MSLSPARRHVIIYDELHTQLKRLLPAHLSVGNNLTLDMIATSERYIPDLIVAARETLRSDDWLLAAADAELVAEIVSPHNASRDRVVKLRGYAASGVPVYLLIDPLERAVTLFFEPSGGSYQEVHRSAFGAAVSLPAPYDGKIDTGRFD